MCIKIIEILLYVSVGARVFGNQIGILNFTGLSGALIVASGIVCFMVMTAQNEKVPVSVYFAALISVFATITDLYYVDLVPRNMLYWTSIMLMVSYIVRDDGASNRCAFFLAACVLGAVWIGGTFLGGALGVQRLGLEPGKVATMFGNPNDLAQISLITALSLLFNNSLDTRLLKIFKAIVSVGLMYIVLLTLSRQGLILIAIGLLGYVLVLYNDKGRRLEVVLLSAVALATAIFFSGEIINIIDGYTYRLGLDSGRVDYWKTAPHDMYITFLSGYGTFDAFNSEGLQPHSAFLWLHLAYGGFCAWFYAAWIIWLGSRTARLIFNERLAPPLKIESGVMFVIFFALQFTGVFTPFNYGCILAVATLEKNFTLAVMADA